MGEAVAFSTSRLRDADLEAIATYLASVPAPPDEPVAQPAAAVMAQGQAIWQDTCSACHQMEGEGVPGLFPPLQANGVDALIGSRWCRRRCAARASPRRA